jgi:hypothetical protein
MRCDLALVERQEPASRGDAVGAEADELVGGGEKFCEEPCALSQTTRRGEAPGTTL